MDRLPKWAQALILVVVIGASGFWLVYRFVINTPEKARARVKEKWDANVAFTTTKELREKGKQKAGLSDYVVEATYVDSPSHTDYANVIIRKLDKDGKATEEIKAPRMSIVVANEVEFTVAVSDATRTTYDEAGNAKAESMPGRTVLTLYAMRMGTREL